jgi:hypothetical protein
MLLLIIVLLLLFGGGGGLLRVFQMGDTRGPGDSRDGRANRGDLVPARRGTLTLSGSN